MASKPFFSMQKPFPLFIFLLICLILLIHRATYNLHHDNEEPKPTSAHHPTAIEPPPRWYEKIQFLINNCSNKLNIGLVNFEVEEVRVNSLSELITINFEKADKNRKWDDFFPEWVDKDGKYGSMKCTNIPLPNSYEKVDVVVARVPEGVRDVFRLQVNLVVSNVLVNSRLEKGGHRREVYVVFIGWSGPMWEEFQCDDMIWEEGDYKIYKPDLERLQQMVNMPVGSCKIQSPSLPQSGSHGVKKEQSCSFNSHHHVPPPDFMKRYERLEELGQGTYGVVWKALDREMNEVVAIKKLKDKYHSYEEFMNLVEVKSHSKMNNHPNIVKLREIVKQNDIMYLVFEYMECSLEKLMEERTKPFSEAEIKYLCFQLFQGLKYIHSKGYIHRDLKPENLLVSKDVIKIGDFGQARKIDNKLPYTDYVTTRWYRAPEVLLGAKVYDFTVDMWAMGAIMVELFNLEPLFDGASEEAMLYKICRVIGTPTETTWTYGLNLASEINFEFPKVGGVKFSKMIPTASPEAVDLIAKLLRWNPIQRGTAMGALEHPFFNSCYNVPRPISKHEKSLYGRKYVQNGDADI